MNIDKKADFTVKNIRHTNIVKVMYSLINDKNKTRNDLAKENNVSLMTIKHIVDDLVASGIVEENVYNGTEVGRKPKMLEINNIYGNIVCINLASKNKITFLIYDIYEQLMDKGVIPIDKNINYKNVLISVINTIKAHLKNLSTQTIGIAVFVPSAYYKDVDLVNYDLIAHFKDLHIKALLKEKFNLDNILVIHDVYSAAKSEYNIMGQSEKSQFYFYCGAGIGGFFIHNGTAILGKDLMAGEIGKMIVSKCEGKYNILEDVASVEAILNKAQELNISRDFEKILVMYNTGDEKIQALVNPALEVIAKILYNLLWIYNPDYIVVDSNYKEYSRLIVNHVKAFLKEVKNEAIPIEVEIREAKYDEYHTMRGCFHMVLDEWVKNIADTNSN